MDINNNINLQRIRESEQKSHTHMYSTQQLYGNAGWLQKPVKTVLDCLPYFQSNSQMRILDLGCGVGRNSIAIAQKLSGIPCQIDCVDILDLAIEKLEEYAVHYGVADKINGIIAPIEFFPIPSESYNWIIAISALEHIDSDDSFYRKLQEIAEGIRTGGIVCLVVNSGVTEHRKTDGCTVPAQFEVNLPTEMLQELLHTIYSGWTVLKYGINEQQYDIPRDCGICQLRSSVVTFVAKKA